MSSETDEIQVADEFTLDGRVVNLIDIPGFDDTTKSGVGVLRTTAFFLAAA